MTNSNKDLLPEPSIHDENGQALFALEDLIAHWKLSAEEMQLLEDKLLQLQNEQDGSDDDKDGAFLLN